MEKLALLVTLETRVGKEKEAEEFLKSAVPLVKAESDTITWYAIRTGSNKFSIFDTFPSEEGRTAHLTGAVAAALMQKAPDLFSKDPVIEKAEVLAVK